MSTEQKTADASKDQVKMIKVDVLDTQYELPEEQAKELIALRDKIGKENLSKGYNNNAAKKAKELELRVKQFEEADAAIKQKQAEEQRKVEESKATSTGEVDKIKNWYNQELEKVKAAASSDVSKWKNSAIKDKLLSIVNSNETVVKSAVNDITKAIFSDNQFDIDTEGRLVAVSDGKPKLADNGDPITAEQLVTKFVEERDWLKVHKGPNGTTEKKVVTTSPDPLAGLSSEQRIELMQKGKLNPKLITKQHAK